VNQSRRAFTLIEIIMVMALIGIVAGWSITKFRASGYRMDSNIRMLQNALIGAQQTAITRNVTVVIRFDADSHRILVHQDADGDDAVGASEVSSYRPLFDGARFIVPDSTIDGAPANYITGAGVVELAGAKRAIRIAPNGSLTGDVVVYLGTISARPADMRALTIVGATARTAFWSRSSGSWRQRDY
jgi:prepilin-type N-terminal cleavage/methylation domain-containing protein